MGTRLDFGSAYHPQIDGRDEVVNIRLANTLRCLVGENTGEWDLVLEMVGFAHNKSASRPTGRDHSRFKCIVDNLREKENWCNWWWSIR